MSFLKPKFVLLALLGLAGPSLLASGCSGDAFSPDGGSTAGVGAMGSEGQGGGSTLTGDSCRGPENCDDDDPCTADFCNARGACDAAPKCAGTQKCCEGDCAECCEDSDCDDGLACTKNQCFLGQCMYVPDDAKCAATEYCSSKDGCRARQACGILSNEDVTRACDDGSTCTADECVNNLCSHTYCTGMLCCEGQTPGCAIDCCNDSQCDKDADPCSVGSCEGGKCTAKPLCGGGSKCCPSADGKTATCGACCSADDCDDSLGCTEDRCNLGQCSHTPNSAECPSGYYCDPAPSRGCTKAPDCTTEADCAKKQPSLCNPRCEAGSCKFEGCGQGTKCCDSGCAACCNDAECSDNIECTADSCGGAAGCTHTPRDAACPGGYCDLQRGCVGCRTDEDCRDDLDCTTDVCNPDNKTCAHLPNCDSGYCSPTTGACVACLSDSDCRGGKLPTNTQPAAIAGAQCYVSKCESGNCSEPTPVVCQLGQVCCPPYGCSKSCGVQTQ